MKIARYSFVLCLLALSTRASSQGVRGAGEVEGALAAMTPDVIKAHLTFLGDDLLQGRRPGTAGYDIAAKYVAATFAALGLEAAGDQGSYFQRVPLLETKPDTARTTVTIESPRQSTETLVYGRDFVTTGDPFETAVTLAAPLVFVGYGIEAPELEHDDYSTIDVKGKIVVSLFGGPARFPATSRAHYSNGLVKAEAAARHGAVGFFNLSSPILEKLYPWQYLAKDTERGAVFWVDKGNEPANAIRQLRVRGAISTTAAQKVLGTGIDVAALYARDTGGQAVGPASVQTILHAQTGSTHRRFDSMNVAAVYRGSAQAGEYVAYSAHLDHVGVGEPVNGDDIYNGVLDNASGTAVMLAVAKAFATLQQRPRRSILFLAVTAEELGLIGSDYFARNPTIPANAIVANINIDGAPVLYDFSDVIALGAEHSSIASSVQRATRQLGVEVTPDPFPDQIFFVRSDQYSFVKQGVPAVFVTEGLKAVDPNINGRKVFDDWLATRYHQPSDDLSQPLNFAAAAKGAKLQFLIGHLLATDRDRPRWNEGDFFGGRFGRR